MNMNEMSKGLEASTRRSHYRNVAKLGEGGIPSERDSAGEKGIGL